MQIVIVDNSLIYFDGISPNVENLLLKNFSVRHPRARFLDNSVWDGWYRRYNQGSQTMARPFLKEVCEVLDKAGVPYDIVDARDKPKVVPDESLVTPDLLLGITLEDYQINTLKAMCQNEVGIISSTTGCHPAGQGILMYDGRIKKVEDIKSGDILMGPDSSPRRVLRTINGKGSIFKVAPIRGVPFFVNEDHILTLVKTGVKSSETIDVSVRDWMQWNKSRKHLYKLFRVQVTHFGGERIDLPLDPYLLGALLGDGGIINCVKFFCSTDDEELLQEVASRAASHGVSCHAGNSQKKDSKCIEYLISNGLNWKGKNRHFGRNPILDALKSLGLLGCNSGNKFIPFLYQTSSEANRLAVLAGILDTDGHITNNNSCDYITKSIRLANDVAFIARSLGFMAIISESYKYDQNGQGGLYYRLSISGDLSRIPMVLSRKKKRAAPRKQKKNNLRTGFSIDKISDNEQYFGFTLDKDGRYLLDDFTVTHNSGKTEAMAGITKILNTNTVIFADIRVVIEQIKDRLELRDIEDGNIGLFYAGQRPNGNKVVVGSIQSLMTPTKPSVEKYKNKDGVYDHEKYEKALGAYKTRLKGAKEFQKIVSEAELLLVDECDKASSTAYKDLFFKHFRGRYRYGFSGTPHDHKKPVEWLFLRERLGSIIYHIDRSSVEKTGRIIPIKPVMLAFGEDGDKTDKTAYDIAEKDYVINNEKFHDFVVSVVQSFEKEKTLIIVDTHEIASLGAALEAKIPNSKFIYGVTSKNQRNNAIKSFERGELRCLIGGKIIKRGLDLKGGADNVIFIGGGTKWSNIDQIVGRAVRKNARGWCRVFGFYIMCNHYLYSHSREQLKAIIDMGYDPMVVFSTGPISGKKLVRSRFKKTKN